MAEDILFNKVIIITRNNAEYSLWLKEEYDDGTNTSGEIITSKSYNKNGRKKYSNLFKSVYNGLIKVQEAEFYIQDGSRNKSNFDQILPNCKSDANTILAIHFGKGGGTKEFPETEAGILNDAIQNKELGAYFAYSLGQDIPKGVNHIFNKIAQKEIEINEVKEQYKKLFNLFIKEGLRFEYDRWIDIVANIQSGISVWELLKRLPDRIKDDEVIKKQKEIVDHMIKNNLQLNDILDFNINNDDMEKLHKKLEGLKNELITKRNTLQKVS